MTAPTTGGEAKPFATKQKGLEDLSVDGAAVYWTVSDGKGGGAVMEAPLKGGAPTKLATMAPSDLGGPLGLVVGESHVQWVHSMAFGSILKVGKAGGGTTTVASKQRSPFGIAADAAGTYWTTFGAGIADGAVMAAGPKGGEPRVIADHQRSPWRIASDGKDVFWTVKGPPGAVLKAPIAGGASTTLVADVKDPTSIALDGEWVYWASDELDVVKKVKKDGSASVVIAESQKGPAGLALDATSVYWPNKADGTIMKAPK
ncbi:MAG: hypothetical protein HYV09_00060 [Deltaproteobacteria bacterium]|nr:hypothetical protein [Deltaproteobacteria bacterium]